MRLYTLSKFLLPVVVLIGFVGCVGFSGVDGYDEGAEGSDDEVYFELDNETGTAVMFGSMDEAIPDIMQDLLQDFPELQTLVLQNVPGAIYSPAVLEAGRIIREAGVNTHIPSDGLAASSGVDLFLAGVERTIEEGAMLGVHSWEGDDVAGFDGLVNAADLPRDHAEHEVYLEFYADMGIPEDFYWFTLQAAPPSDIHFMTAEEIDRYNMLTLN